MQCKARDKFILQFSLWNVATKFDDLQINMGPWVLMVLQILAQPTDSLDNTPRPFGLQGKIQDPLNRDQDTT